MENETIYIFPKTNVSLHEVTSISVRKVTHASGSYWFEFSVECESETTDHQKLTEVHNMTFFVKDSAEVSIEREANHGDN